MPDILKISEIFLSAQGEGMRMGVPSIFIRLAGCSLNCSFCDTPQALTGGSAMPVARIMERVERLRGKSPRSQVVITGGEPLEQRLHPLVNALGEGGFFLAVETNGVHFQDLAVNWWTISPKAAAGFSVAPRLGKAAAEFKLVTTGELNRDVVADLRGRYPGPPIFLQPDARDPNGLGNALGLYERCQEAGIPEVRLGVQLHRVYDIE